MQTYFFIKEGALSVSDDGIIDINIDKMIPAARKMLTEIIEVQLSQSFARGEKYVNDYFVWSDEIEKVSEKLKATDKSLNGMILTPLADYLMNK